jgi:transcriptional regulator with XRE-family HTH domain
MVKKILENIRIFREKANLSQDTVADRMNITQSKYARFERGATKTDLEMVVLFCKVINKPLLEVITYPDTYINVSDISQFKAEDRVALTIELNKDKREQVLKLVFGENNLELFNK